MERLSLHCLLVYVFRKISSNNKKLVELHIIMFYLSLYQFANTNKRGLSTISQLKHFKHVGSFCLDFIWACLNIGKSEGLKRYEKTKANVEIQGLSPSCCFSDTG